MARKPQRSSKAQRTKPNGKQSEFALLPAEIEQLREADAAVGRLRFALGDIALSIARLEQRRTEVVAALESAQQALNEQGNAVANRVRAKPDDRFVVDLTKKVIQRASA